MAEDKIFLGAERELLGTFTLDVDDSLIDPTNLEFKIREPDGVETTYIYGTDLEVEKMSEGVFRVLWICRKSGTHSFRWDTSGIGSNITVVGEQRFFVEYSDVLRPANVLGA